MLFYIQSQQTLNRFYQVIVSSVVFGNQQSLLKQFNIDNYMIVVQTEKLVQQIVVEVVKSNSQKLNQVKQLVHDYLLSNLKRLQLRQGQQENLSSLTNSIALSIFTRLEEIKTRYVLQAMATGALYLQDINWKVNRLVSSSAKTFIGTKHPYTFYLSLYLNHSPNKQTTLLKGNRQLISLEMTKPQLKQFLNELKKLKTQLNS